MAASNSDVNKRGQNLAIVNLVGYEQTKLVSLLFLVSTVHTKAWEQHVLNMCVKCPSQNLDTGKRKKSLEA